MTTWSMCEKSSPVAVTTVPVGPVYGVSLSVTVNVDALVTALSVSVSTIVILPLVAPNGTCAVILVELIVSIVNAVPLRAPVYVCSVAKGNRPSIVSDRPIAPLGGAMLEIPKSTVYSAVPGWSGSCGPVTTTADGPKKFQPPSGTVKSISVGPTTVSGASCPLNVSVSPLAKPVPVTLTSLPVRPEVESRLVTASSVRSAADHVTGEELDVPFFTVTRPYPPAGRFAVRVLSVEWKTAGTVGATVPGDVPLPPKKTLLAELKPTPLIVIESPTAAVAGAKPVTLRETVKVEPLTEDGGPASSGFVTLIVPVAAPSGTFAVSFAAETHDGLAAETLLVNAIVASGWKPEPLIVTSVLEPATPLVGVKLVIFGRTTYESLVSVPPPVVTVIGPVTAVVGMVALSTPPDVENEPVTWVPFAPVKRTAVTPVRAVPEIVTCCGAAAGAESPVMSGVGRRVKFPGDSAD